MSATPTSPRPASPAPASPSPDCVDVRDIGHALCAATRRLKAAGVEQPRREARLLLGHALGLSPTALLADPVRPLSAAEAAGFEALVARRAGREPLSRIFGRREFWGLEFRLSSETLDPRPDSETLVEAALARVPDRRLPLRVLDLGTGSGCLLLAVLSELPNATGLGLDCAPGALATAAANAAALGLETRARMHRADWTVPDWTAGLGRFDLILTNPPYVETTAQLAPEVAEHDPAPALFAGPDGLAAYRALLPSLPDLLAGGACALVEIGAGQADAVAALARSAALSETDRVADLSGTPRCLVLEAQKTIGM